MQFPCIACSWYVERASDVSGHLLAGSTPVLVVVLEWREIGPVVRAGSS